MQQPPGFEDSRYPNHVCKLRKSIYGLKQSPRAWYSRPGTRLHQLGFHSSKADTSLFIFRQGAVVIYMLVYVDDIVIAGSCPRAVDRLLRTLAGSFPIKDLGRLSYFLGIEATYNPGGMVLSQRKYADDLLHRAHMENCKEVSTPMSVTDKLAAGHGTPLDDDDAFRYRSMVGGLQYLTLTHPDISFCYQQGVPIFGQPTNMH